MKKQPNGTHFLDTKGKLQDAKAILATYEDALREAERAGDTNKIKRYEELIRRQENHIRGLEAYIEGF